MAKGVKLELESKELGKLNKMLKGSEKKINEAAFDGLKRVGLKTLAAAQRNLKDAKSIASGQLINSGKTAPQPDFSVDVEFNANHAIWVEYGRKAGGMPPIKPIFEWIKKRGLSDAYAPSGGRRKRGADFAKKAMSLAYAIAKSIARNGTKAKPFLFPAMRENEKEMMRVINEAIKKVL